ncbi:hypothetical protein BU17DRAFT_71367 [Hysterangium stoloniferum]|nr:hypothetical protein BU17DRAFT_71367 [Hysterangium stoloniferum]
MGGGEWACVPIQELETMERNTAWAIGHSQMAETLWHLDIKSATMARGDVESSSVWARDNVFDYLRGNDQIPPIGKVQLLAELAMPVAPPPTPAPTPPTPATTRGVVDDDDVSDVEEIHGHTSPHPDMWDEQQPIVSFTVGEAQGAGDLQESGRRYTSADLNQSSNWTQT